MRLQLARPNGTVLSNATYNAIFTMHGTTMIFLVVMPLSVGLGNYPRAADDRRARHGLPQAERAELLAVPVRGGLFLYSSFFFGGAPDKGWFSYAPLTEYPFSPTPGMTFWALAILMLGISSTLSSINFIVTVACKCARPA